MKRKRRKIKLVDDTFSAQKKYLQTDKGQKASKKAKEKYDNKDKEKRRKQKRDYMRRKRAEDKSVWR
jgi:hypothetical protein